MEKNTEVIQKLYGIWPKERFIYLHNLRGNGWVHPLKNLNWLACECGTVMQKDSACILWICSELEKYFLKLWGMVAVLIKAQILTILLAYLTQDHSRSGYIAPLC